jgi:hypothetical protein
VDYDRASHSCSPVTRPYLAETGPFVFIIPQAIVNIELTHRWKLIKPA